MSFYTSVSGLKNAQTDLNVIAHNIANAETTGFKKGRAEFADVVASSAYANPRLIQGMGASVEAITQNFSIGPIEQTGSALDVAISGDGFFATKSSDTGDMLFTRNGSFTTDENGFIHDGAKNRLQMFAPGADPAADAPIDAQVPSASAGGAAYAGLIIDKDGSVTVSYADGTNEVIGTVALASFISQSGLKQMGSANWETSGLSGPPQYGLPGEGTYGSLISGALERSNVDIAEELVNLISAQRYFQANAKAIDTATQITQSVMNLRT